MGEPVTFSGTACPHDDVVLVNIDAGSTTSGTQAEVTPHRDGTWRATRKLGDSTLLGTRLVAAVCAQSFDHRVVFAYPPAHVQVSTFRTLHVAPGTTIRPDTRLSIAPSRGCPRGPLSDIGVSVGLLAPGEYVGAVGSISNGASARIATDALGNWSGGFSVPADTHPGRYVLSAYCTFSRSYAAWYETVPIVVVPAAR